MDSFGCHVPDPLKSPCRCITYLTLLAAAAHGFHSPHRAFVPSSGGTLPFQRKQRLNFPTPVSIAEPFRHGAMTPVLPLLCPGRISHDGRRRVAFGLGKGGRGRQSWPSDRPDNALVATCWPCRTIKAVTPKQKRIELRALSHASFSSAPACF
jgi:hypothetical protein